MFNSVNMASLQLQDIKKTPSKQSSEIHLARSSYRVHYDWSVWNPLNVSSSVWLLLEPPSKFNWHLFKAFLAVWPFIHVSITSSTPLWYNLCVCGRERQRETERKERQSSVNYLYPSRQVVTTVYLVARMKSQAVQRKCSRHHDLFSTLTTGGTMQNSLGCVRWQVSPSRILI